MREEKDRDPCWATSTWQLTRRGGFGITPWSPENLLLFMLRILFLPYPFRA
jgi:hypothetical protein